MKDFKDRNDLARGLRNNNPGNLKAGSKKQYDGEILPRDKDFLRFANLTYGLRALLVLLAAYMVDKQKRSVKNIITTYAPDNENNTAAYIAAVSKDTGYQDSRILLPSESNILSIAKAIVRHELGADTAARYIENSDWQEAVNKAAADSAHSYLFTKKNSSSEVAAS